MSVFQAERERLLAAIALRIRQSLDLDSIINQTVEEVRLFLQTDRVLVYRFEPDWSGLMVAESVIPPYQAVIGSKIKDPCLTKKHIEKYQQGVIRVIDNVETAQLPSCYQDLLANFDVKANLVVPIIAEEKLWGLLIAQHCKSPRQWDSSEIELLKLLANHVGIAVQQAELYQQVQSINSYLERKVKNRTAKLEQAVKFEALITRITQNVRDSLDETQILQKVTQELEEVLHIECCKIELYDNSHSSATIVYEYTTKNHISHEATRQVADFPEYQQLLQKKSLQFVERIPLLNPSKGQITRLICPIFDDKGILGNIWLLRLKEEVFDELEIRLVEQVANQCAIAIRQARLYEKSQAQVKELEKLNTLKDDFLKTISHELRTPMTSILLASQTLEKLIKTQGIQGIKSEQFQRVFQIFKGSCQQQNKSVNDLLTLCYLDAQNATLIPEIIDIKEFIIKIVEPFKEQARRQQQQLVVNIAKDISSLQSDTTLLERVINELLTNACKYTPENETITVTAEEKDDKIYLSIRNSGIEIPLEEQESIFEKFYRIPSHDPWKHGGSGIGLALVKKLVKLLNATVKLDSRDSQTTFTIQFAIDNFESKI
ncbi:histidine kinase with GAF domain [Rivularia sp. PCC 7116]|uniref:sensor histidine kinase n=1 Tax=Rivularia sp. PCC 7116 TaxID=373994 RepID=UPI00029F3D1C|nr:GAF domain-containing sensor histidine kinase [Rivularia sp. PCC 7116]AFY56438.1 histidine kinase with GAF domain [Rivularia sp. PCC 7116]